MHWPGRRLSQCGAAVPQRRSGAGRTWRSGRCKGERRQCTQMAYRLNGGSKLRCKWQAGGRRIGRQSGSRSRGSSPVAFKAGAKGCKQVGCVAAAVEAARLHQAAGRRGCACFLSCQPAPPCCRAAQAQLARPACRAAAMCMGPLLQRLQLPALPPARPGPAVPVRQRGRLLAVRAAGAQEVVEEGALGRVEKLQASPPCVVNKWQSATVVVTAQRLW